MSEEILKALMQLFAIIAKQDEGTSASEREYVDVFLRSQLKEETVQGYVDLFEKFAGIKKKEPGEENVENNEPPPEKKVRRTSVIDSVKSLAICKKINKTLTQKQKVIVLVRLYELINADKKFTPLRMELINTAGNVFNISIEELSCIERFVVEQELGKLDQPELMIIGSEEETPCPSCKHMVSHALDGHFIILKVLSVDLYFIRYTGKDEVFLNGLTFDKRRIYLFAPGSTLKTRSKPIYYSDVISNFLADKDTVNISFEVKDLKYSFPNGNTGLHNMSFSETQGKLVGIMGASGAGKTTLLNVLMGNLASTKGAVVLNGLNLIEDREKLEGVFGYIPQDDLLIEELTVFQNLYFNAKLCFKDMQDSEIESLVSNVLNNLGLAATRDLKVGSPMNKTISGGQRKRLNIALELIREPAVMFVDEPTSGLSSRDSENVMDLLRELAMKGKLIFVVIHQPSSDIYKMFDRILILDTGGYLIFNGNPIEAVMYFKQIDQQVNSDVGECPSCGNVNPEVIFNIIEAREVDEYGNFQDDRRIAPEKWSEHWNTRKEDQSILSVSNPPPGSLNIPKRIHQFLIYTKRDFLSKISNAQYVLINLIEPPLLAFFLAILIRYKESGDEYVFRENENIPAYIFMLIIVALFVGLTVSAEEIFKDRKILKREKFLNLSRFSYLISKIGILFSLSALQSFLLILVGNAILGIKGMYFDYWLMIFSVSCMANILGLNISATFNSAVTIYILIPLMIIPQMVLGGAMFPFDKLNKTLGGGNRVPLIAEVMASRWAYEGLLVRQFKNNNFQVPFYRFEKLESFYDFKQTYYIPYLYKIANETHSLSSHPTDSSERIINRNLQLLSNELVHEVEYFKTCVYNNLPNLTKDGLNTELKTELKIYLTRVYNDFGILKENNYNDLISLVENEDDNKRLEYEISELSNRFSQLQYAHLADLNPVNYNDRVSAQTKQFLKLILSEYETLFNQISREKDRIISTLKSTEDGAQKFDRIRNDYFNNYLSDLCKNTMSKQTYEVRENRIFQVTDPIFRKPVKMGLLNLKAHQYAPEKFMGNMVLSTFSFNVLIVWFMTLILFITLYFETFLSLMNFLDRFKSIKK